MMAPTISGSQSGVAKWISELEPRAFITHSLNLAISNSKLSQDHFTGPN